MSDLVIRINQINASWSDDTNRLASIHRPSCPRCGMTTLMDKITEIVISKSLIEVWRCPYCWEGKLLAVNRIRGNAKEDHP